MLYSAACIVFALLPHLALATSQACQIDCPDDIERIICAFDETHRTYKVFTSLCALNAHNECNKDAFKETPFRFCVKRHFKARRLFESCPVFCAEYYRPVCAAAQYRDYKYRSFTNGCFLDQVNCRGEEDEGYIEVPLSYCPRHAMKNIYKEKVVVSGLHNNEDY